MITQYRKKKMLERFNRIEKMKRKIRGAKKSLTIWANSVFASIVMALPIAQDQVPLVKAYIPPNIYHYLLMVVIFGNVILRFRTNKGLDEK